MIQSIPLNIGEVLCNNLRQKMNLSTSYHPQTDGNTERVHRTIEQILRAFVHNCPEEWIRDLRLAELCYNKIKPLRGNLWFATINAYYTHRTSKYGLDRRH